MFIRKSFRCKWHQKVKSKNNWNLLIKICILFWLLDALNFFVLVHFKDLLVVDTELWMDSTCNLSLRWRQRTRKSCPSKQQQFIQKTYPPLSFYFKVPNKITMTFGERGKKRWLGGLVPSRRVKNKKNRQKNRSDEIQKRIVHMVPTIWLMRNKPLLKTSWTSQLQSLNANQKVENSTLLGYLDNFVCVFIYHSGASTWVAFVTNICDRSYHICDVG